MVETVGACGAGERCRTSAGGGLLPGRNIRADRGTNFHVWQNWRVRKSSGEGMESTPIAYPRGPYWELIQRPH